MRKLFTETLRGVGNKQTLEHITENVILGAKTLLDKYNELTQNEEIIDNDENNRIIREAYNEAEKQIIKTLPAQEFEEGDENIASSKLNSYGKIGSEARTGLRLQARALMKDDNEIKLLHLRDKNHPKYQYEDGPIYKRELDKITNELGEKNEINESIANTSVYYSSQRTNKKVNSKFGIKEDKDEDEPSSPGNTNSM